jgi:type III secretion protein J
MSRLARFMGSTAIAVLCLFLSACSEQELYGKLSERAANEMVAVLQSNGISAKKLSKEGQQFAVTTSQDSFAKAVEVLRANGYPKDQFDSAGQIFKKEGFVSSPIEEHARLEYAKSQELSDTLSHFDGVILARVNLAVPERDPLSDKPRVSSASVYIKHRKEVDLLSKKAQMVALVVNGVQGLPYENVTVVLDPSEAAPVMSQSIDAPAGSSGFSQAALTIALVGCILAAIGGGLWYLQRYRPSRERGLSLVAAEEPDRGA